MNKIIIYSFAIIWTACLIYIGIPEINIMLGGAAAFYFLLPFVVFANFKYRYYGKLLWSISITLASYIAINFLYSYFLVNTPVFRLLTNAYVVAMPLSFISMGYLYTIYYFLPDISSLSTNDDSNIVRYFWGFSIAIIVSPIVCVIPFSLTLIDSGVVNAYGISYLVGMGVLISGSLLFLYKIRKISTNTLIYFARPIQRFNGDLGKLKKYVIIGFIITIFFSFGFELYRNSWIIWGETVIAFLIYIFILFQFVKIIFITDIDPAKRPANLYMPSIKSKLSIVALLLGLIATVISVIITLEHYGG